MKIIVENKTTLPISLLLAHIQKSAAPDAPARQTYSRNLTVCRRSNKMSKRVILIERNIAVRRDKFIIDYEDVSLAVALVRAVAVAEMGRVSNSGQQYCYCTTFADCVVYTDKNQYSDRFIIRGRSR